MMCIKLLSLITRNRKFSIFWVDCFESGIFIQYLSRVCSLTTIFCCWYTTETAGSSYVYCGMADKIAMIFTMWVLYSYLLEKTDFKNWNGGFFFYQYSISKLLQNESQNAESRRVPQELSSLYFIWRSCIYW